MDHGVGCVCQDCILKRAYERLGFDNISEHHEIITIEDQKNFNKVVDLIEWKKKKGLLNG